MGRTSEARERLVECAMQLFHQRSYESVGVSELCAGAGVHKGSFYHFFPSKEDLAAAVIDAQWEQVRAEVLDPALAPDVAPLARIERYFARVARMQRAEKAATGRMPGCPIANLSGELCSHEPKLRRRLVAVYDAMRAAFEATLRDAVRQGELPRGTDLRAGADALVSFSEGALLLAAARNDPGLLARLGKRALALVAAPVA